jgi:hypothetical protein
MVFPVAKPTGEIAVFRQKSSLQRFRTLGRR